jgi:aspartate-semialdehyde dehydrogenase
MKVAIAGAHGKIGLRLTRLLVARGDGVLARLLADSRSYGSVLYVSSGEQSIERALEEALGSPG